ncbi:hypothetical protein HYX18_04650 [Candidatus Woesearchaeota archaeon]|nr:hypothetical protein [Candidatus Woesearchaeota archaeon]
MSPNQVLRKIDKIIKENPRAFEALLEYEKTGKLPKVVYRERLNITIDSNILNRFKRYCKSHNYNMSKLIESYMKKEIGVK